MVCLIHESRENIEEPSCHVGRFFLFIRTDFFRVRFRMDFRSVTRLW